MSHALKCYNVTIEEGEEDLQNINILETKGHCKVKGLQIENPYITASLKMKQANIGTEAKPKFMKIGDYWDNVTMDKVIELL